MKTVMYIVEDKKAPQFRYRVKNIAEALVGSKKYRVKYYLKTELAIAEVYLRQVDLVVILRQTAKDASILEFIKIAQENGKKVLFDIDDLVFGYKDLFLLMWSTNAKNILFWLGYVWGIRRIAKKVDGFITTNDFLAEKIKKNFGKPCSVIRNSLNKKQIEIADKCIKKKGSINKRRRTNNLFKIGYFSGSPTHERDFRVAEKDILRFLTKHGDAILEVVGYMKFSRQAKNMIKNNRIKYLPMMEYSKLEEKIAEVDVNIAPLLINDFTNSKSELKFFEAGIVEIVTIASPTAVFDHAIVDGKNGCLAKPGEWYSKLEYVYQNKQARIKMTKQARKYSLKHYYGKEVREEIESVYDYYLG